MTATKDWLPGSHEGRHTQGGQTWNYLTKPEIRQRIGLGIGTPPGQWFDTDYTPKWRLFDTAYTEWRDPSQRTKTITAALTRAENDWTTIHRRLYNGFLRDNPLVTEMDYVRLGLPERKDKVRTRVSVPQSKPEARVELPASGVVDIIFRNAGAETSGKPVGVHGAIIAWLTVDAAAPVPAREALTHQTFDTDSPLRLTFDSTESARRLYFVLCWENTRGERGPWSDLYNTVIP
jgi:hypothetical protein